MFDLILLNTWQHNLIFIINMKRNNNNKREIWKRCSKNLENIKFNFEIFILQNKFVKIVLQNTF